MTYQWIDVHQHTIPEFYRALLDERGLTAGGWPTPAWFASAALRLMDEIGTGTAVLSVSAPGVHLGDDKEARALARRVNEFQAQLVADSQGRFGSFASIPLPDVQGAVDEAVYALDELHADGVVLMSNINGTYLGDHAFLPLWEALNQRAAVVFIHPTAPQGPSIPGLPGPLIDYPFDTTRTALHLVARGVIRRFQNVKVILSHAGGFLPYAAARMEGLAFLDDTITPEQIRADLKRFYFDTAL